MDRQFNHFIGSPILQCSPFAQIVLSNQKRNYCEWCFQNISESHACPACRQYFYCSHECLQHDSSYHQSECSTDLLNRIKEKFPDTLFTNMAENEAIYGSFSSVNEYFTPEDIVDYSLLFFRVLKRSKFENKDEDLTSMYTPFNSSVGDLQQQIDWKDIPVSINSHYKSKRQCLSSRDDLLPTYLDRFDSLTDEEAVDFDRLLGFEMPSDEYFREIILKNDVKCVLRGIIDKTVSGITDEYIDWNYGLHQQDQFSMNALDSENFEEHSEDIFPGDCDARELSEEELYALFYEDLRKKKIWNYLEKLPYEQITKHMEDMFELFKKSYFDSREKAQGEDSQKAFNTNLDYELNVQTVFYDKLPDADKYVSNNLRYDSTLLNENECDNIALLKMNYRLNHLESLLRNPTTKGSELEYYFGFWINSLMQLLTQHDMLKAFGAFNYQEIQKAFYITIRFAIAITDVLCILPIARAVYLPLCQFKHHCFANTSLVFEDNNLKMYYLPKEELNQQTLQLLKSKSKFPGKTLRLKDVTVNFQYEITTKDESLNLYVWSKLRMLNCNCERCEMCKANSDQLEIKLFDEFMERDRMEVEYDYYNYSDDNEPGVNQIDYDYEFGQLSKANLQYGNRLDLEYSKRIYKLLIDMVDTFRIIFGFYHPQVNIILLHITCCHFTIVKSCKDMVEIFYRHKYIHRFLKQLLESLPITNGVNHHWIRKVEFIHRFCHESMEQLFVEHKQEISELDQQNSTSLLDEKFVSLENCQAFHEHSIRTSFVDEEIINRRQLNKNSADDYYYNPFMSNEEQPKLIAEVDEQHVKRVTSVLNILSEICDFFSFRFL